MAALAAPQLDEQRTHVGIGRTLSKVMLSVLIVSYVIVTLSVHDLDFVRHQWMLTGKWYLVAAFGTDFGVAVGYCVLNGSFHVAGKISC